MQDYQFIRDRTKPCNLVDITVDKLDHFSNMSHITFQFQTKTFDKANQLEQLILNKPLFQFYLASVYNIVLAVENIMTVPAYIIKGNAIYQEISSKFGETYSREVTNLVNVYVYIVYVDFKPELLHSAQTGIDMGEY